MGDFDELDAGNPFGDDGELFGKTKEPSDEESLNEILHTAPDDLGAICCLGHIYRQKGEYDRAESAFRKILSISGGNHSAKAVAYCNLGALSIRLGDLQKALEHYQEACNYFELRENFEGLAATYCTIGNIYRKMKDDANAEHFYKTSLKINEKLQKASGMIADLTSLGQIYYNLEDFSKAEELFRRALELEESRENKSGMAIMYGNIGAIAKKRNDLELAREYWTTSLSLFTELGATQMKVKVQRWLDFLPKSG